MTPYACAVLGAALGLAGTVLAVLSRCLPRAARPAPGPLPVLVMEYRYCPDECRVRAVVTHPDGTATCGDCHTHIPATED